MRRHLETGGRIYDLSVLDQWASRLLGVGLPAGLVQTTLGSSARRISRHWLRARRGKRPSHEPLARGDVIRHAANGLLTPSRVRNNSGQASVGLCNEREDKPGANLTPANQYFDRL